tara:strand:+ start:7189 stop:10614 length:3426 start_codon:yes stop_codon:yes gene_type:complete
MLKRDKTQVRLPSGSNISINAPTQSPLNPLFDAGINYLQDKITRDDQLKADVLSSKIENIKIKTDEYATQNRIDTSNKNEIQRRINFDKAQAEKAEAARLKQIADDAKKLKDQNDHRQYSLAKIQLNNYASDLAIKHWNNPAEFDAELKAYYEEQSKNMPQNDDEDYELDYYSQYNSVRNTHYGKIYKDFRTSGAEGDWETIKNVANQASQFTFENIKNIESISELLLHGTTFTNQMAELEKGFVKWQGAHEQYANKDYLNEIHFPILEDHDTNLLTHALANSEKFGILNGTIESTYVAEAILNVWGGIVKPNEINKLGLSKEDSAMVETFSGILMNNTHPNWGTEKQEIYDKVKNEIENKRDIYKNDFIERNKDIQTTNTEFVNNINWDDPNQVFPSEAELRANATRIGSDGNIESDPDLTSKLIAQRNDYIQLREAVSYMITDSEASQLKAVQMLKGTQWEGNAFSVVMESKYRKLFGANFNSVYSFDKLAESIKNAGTTPIPETTLAILAEMEKDEYFPNEYIETLTTMKTLKLDSEDEQNALINMAVVYNQTIGKNTIGVGSLQDMTLAKTLHDVYHAWKSNQMNPIPAVQKWKEIYDFDEKAKGKLRESINQYIAENEEIAFYFKDEVVKAVDAMEWVSMAKYAGLIEKSLGGEIELENLMQDKNTFYLGFWKNMSIEKSGLIEYKKILTQLVMENLGNNVNPNSFEIQESFDKMKIQAVLEMSKKDYDISNMTFHSQVKDGPVLMTKGTSPEAITGMNREQLSTNALAFAVQTMQSMSGEEISNQLGIEFPSDNIADYYSRMYDLVDEGKIKLEYMPSTADKGNEQFHIWFKNDQNNWTSLKKNGVPVAWTPNNRYSMNMGYTRSSLMEELAQETARANTEKYFTKDRGMFDFRGVVSGAYYPDTPEGRENYYKNELFLQRNIIQPLKDNFIEFQDSIAETFGWNDQIKDSISEKITEELTQVNIAVDTKQQELNESFDSDSLIFTHYSLYSDPIDLRNKTDVKALRAFYTSDGMSKKEQDKTIQMILDGKMQITNEDKFQMINMRVKENYETFGEIYKDIGVVVEPAHQFVLQDIIDVVGPEIVNKESPIYNAIKNENYGVALKEIKNLKLQFPNQARFNALLTYWGNPKNAVR